ncbi:MAG: prolyl-tRNA synthetase associated domain-containing protein [Alphaproteobacteria bacterium]|nr:prolyl-tRNA synthetase associated domain-containing protein [Alphaproteobacteria bacterium]
MFDEQSLLEKLEQLCIKYDYVSHPAVFTSEQANEVHPELKGAHCKNLFVKDRTDKKWLLVIPDDKRADLKSVAEKIGSARLSFCNSEELFKCLGVTPGSVTPLAVINDINNQIELFVDKTIMNWNVISCHPMINTATISITPTDFQKFIKYTNHDLNIIDLA